jgi:predicted acylesterase/phospholipase RssA
VFGLDTTYNGSEYRFDHNLLEKVIKEVVKEKVGDENGIMADSTKELCHCFVVASRALAVDGPPVLFRSYQCSGFSADRCTIWEAGRATTALPFFFNPIFIDNRKPGFRYVGGIVHNNPSEYALAEAERIWGQSGRPSLVSIGSGKQKPVKLIVSPGEVDTNWWCRLLRWRSEKISGGVSTLHHIAESCVKLCASSEDVHRRVSALTDVNYHRFNVDKGLEEVSLEDWSKIEDTKVESAQYCLVVKENLASCASLLI